MSTTINNKSRLQWADAARGFAILLVLIGHSCPPDAFNVLIYAFHMPLFFLLSGIFLVLDKPLKPILYKRIRTILVPFFVYNIVLLFSDWRIVAFSPNYHTPIDIQSRLLGTLTGWRGGIFSSSLWFLPALFMAQWAVIACYRKGQKCHKHSYLITTFLWFMLTLLGIIYCQLIGIELPMSFDAALVASGFLIVGHQWMSHGISHMKGWPLLTTTIVFLLSAYGNYLIMGMGSNHVDMSTNTLGNIPFFYVGAITGSFLIIRVSCILTNLPRNLRFVRGLQWCGYHSLAIYCIHRIPMNLVIAFTNLVPWLNEPTVLSEGIRSAIIVVATVLFLIPAILIVNRWFPWTLGKSYTRDNHLFFSTFPK